MAKINTLHIHNFKFFGQEKPLELKGKHLLVYGENGSGKSTIYWALYTLLECASKKKDEDIKKYFERGTSKSDSLVNIYAVTTAAGDFNSFVEAELDNSSKYRIAFDAMDIRKNQQAELSNVVSDFVNYRLLYKAYDFAHSEIGDLYLLFAREVLPYVEFSPLENGTDSDGNKIYLRRASAILEKLWRGPGVTINAKGDRILAPKHTPQYKDYEANVRRFNTDLESLLAHINLKGNEILQQEFGYNNFEFKLKLQRYAGIDKKDKKFYKIPPQINLEIPSYNGVSSIIHKPHSFLNEAKLSALALAIRLAVLDRNYDSSAELKVLVLDDLLLSLDMQNRDKVLELLLEKYVFKYQIILLTHDYQFFEIAKNRIKLKNQQSEWLKWEMYAEESASGSPKPFMLANGTHLENAGKYICKKDFAVAGNYLRKEAESFVRSFLPKRKQMSKDFSVLDLNGKINKAIEFAIANNMSANTQSLFSLLDEHRKFIFNPLSHDSYDASRLKADVLRAIDTMQALQKIESKTILSAGEVIWFELADLSGDKHRFDIELCDELKLLKEKDQIDKLALCPFFMKYQKNGAKSSGLQEQSNLEKFFTEKYNQSNKTLTSDFWDELKLADGSSLRSRL